MGRRTALMLLTVALIAALPACSGDTQQFEAKATTGTIEWNACKGGIQCAHLTVDAKPNEASAHPFSLALARRPANGAARGVLFANPGGPGGSGVELIRGAESIFSKDILKNFDLVSWDPRGTGASDPVLCEDKLDAYYGIDKSPDTPAERDAAVAETKRFVRSCEQESGGSLPYVSTAETVEDMDDIRAAMGVAQISYVGFSYGTLIGAMYADKYPQHVRAMVLDGPVDPSLDYGTASVQQAQGFERALNEFFAYCKRDGCGFASQSDPATSFDRLVKSVDAEPVFAEINGERRTLGPGEFDIGVASALYQGRNGWNNLGRALAQTATGDGSRLLALSDEYTQRAKGGTYSNSTAALSAVSCIDSAVPPTIDAVDHLAAEAAKVAPRFGEATIYLGLPCTFWPVKPSGTAAPIHAPDAPPIVVVGATNDPATPYNWAQALSSQLESATLVTVNGEAHTSYGRGNECVDRAVDDYLLDLTVPPAGTTC
jgi:pimeloyl-ACP methyl ester carboxylesterase